jgi:thiamine kinase
MPDASRLAALAQAVPTVRAALASEPATSELAAARLAPVPGGLSNYAWRADTPAGEPYFVRLARAEGEALGADHANECRVLRLTSAADLSPAVLRCDPARRLLVTRWVETRQPGAPVREPGQLAEVARALAELHRLPVPADLRRVDFEAQARTLQGATDADPFGEIAARVFDALRAERQPEALCHNDLNPLNLLFERSGRAWLVDWEYAGLGERAIDLASFASQHGLDARRRRTLLDAYAAAGGTIGPRRFEWALWAFDYVQWLWYRAGAARHDGWLAPGLAADRAAWLAASLRVRATRLLRCNNAVFAG